MLPRSHCRSCDHLKKMVAVFTMSSWFSFTVICGQTRPGTIKPNIFLDYSISAITTYNLKPIQRMRDVQNDLRNFVMMLTFVTLSQAHMRLNVWVALTKVTCLLQGLTYAGCVLPVPGWITTNSASDAPDASKRYWGMNCHVSLDETEQWVITSK